MKNKSMASSLLLLGALCFGSCSSTKKLYTTSCIFPEGSSIEEKVRLSAHVVPSQRQLNWQKMEYTAFICYGINTFTDKEWGTGKEDPKQFKPTNLDAGQWVSTAKEAGMKMILLTCKHHDGFCLWPSKETDFSVESSPWKGGKGDLVREVSDACRKEGLKFAVYLSPWDMNHPTYGTEAYNDVFTNQLTELLTQYGQVDEVWFDGACGEGPNGKKQVYDFKRYYETIRKLQPQAVIAVMGPDVRWVGTESGYGRDTEWSVIPAAEASLKEIANSSQQEAGTGTFLPTGGNMKKDMGSRLLLEKANGVIWYPSEVDVSIRPGWYYHAKEDVKVKTPQKLIDIYYSSVGKNSLLLLNIPPDKRGLIHENDKHSLLEMKRILQNTFAHNYVGKKYKKLTDNRLDTYWQGSAKNKVIEIALEGEQKIDRLLLQENITQGQRIEEFMLECLTGSEWRTVATGTTVGFKRILRFDSVTCNKVRITILKSRDVPQLAEVGLYKSSDEEKM
ncbi:alpha-L-fucosidase [Bacteroides sp.]|uniref:alpha-L-fucosidase n=1 Tax=Bacteroides sp. TaxID=29523 RepID=UPI002FC6652F